MTTKAREANQFAFLVIIPLIVPTQLLVPIISDPDGTLARVLSLIPFTALLVPVVFSFPVSVPLLLIPPHLVLMVVVLQPFYPTSWIDTHAIETARI